MDKNLRKAITCLLRKIIESKETIQSQENTETKDDVNRNERYFSLYSLDAASSVKGKNSDKKKCGC